MKINFIKDIEVDIGNWQQSLSANSYGMDWSKMLPKDISLDQAKNIEYLRRYLEEKYYNSGKIDDFKNWLETNSNQEQIKTDLEFLVGRSFPFEVVDVKITSFWRAPYDAINGSLFMIFRNSGRENSITNLYHEIMHFFFHRYYWEECKNSGLSEARIHDLKEACTVLLNPILEKRELPLDKGYPAHQELRSKLVEIWQEENNFDLFLKRVLGADLVSRVMSPKP